MKFFIFKIISIFQIPQIALRFFKAPRILLYHGVTNKADFLGIENYRQKHIFQDKFRQQIQFLKTNFHIVSLQELVTVWNSSHKQARNMLAITFDDGYQNIFQNAWPILKEYNIPFTIFLPTNFIEQQEPLWVDRLEYAINKNKNNELSREKKIEMDAEIRQYAKSISDKKRKELIDEKVGKCGIDLREHLSEESDYRPISWQEIRQMLNFDIVSVGAHTVSHAIATRLPLREFQQEVIDSKNLIEKRLNIQCSSFAYPNGKKQDFSDKTAEVLRNSGFDIALTTEMNFINNKAKCLALPRLAMDGTEAEQMFLLAISGVRMFFRNIRNIVFGKQRFNVNAVIHFNEQAKEYRDSYFDLTPRGYSFRVRRELIMELVKDLPVSAKILDIGCGPGVYTKELLARGFEFYGIDPAEDMIRVAKENFGKNPQAHFSIGRIESISFPDKSFNGIIAAGVFEYLKSPLDAFKESHRVLCPGGAFIVSFPFRWSLARLWDNLIVRQVGKLIRLFSSRRPKIDSREFSKTEVVKMLEQSGFSVKRVLFYNARLFFTPLHRWFPKLSVCFSKMFENICPSFLKTGFIVLAVRREYNKC